MSELERFQDCLVAVAVVGDRSQAQKIVSKFSKCEMASCTCMAHGCITRQSLPTPACTFPCRFPCLRRCADWLVAFAFVHGRVPMGCCCCCCCCRWFRCHSWLWLWPESWWFREMGKGRGAECAWRRRAMSIVSITDCRLFVPVWHATDSTKPTITTIYNSILVVKSIFYYAYYLRRSAFRTRSSSSFRGRERLTPTRTPNAVQHPDVHQTHYAPP